MTDDIPDPNNPSKRELVEQPVIAGTPAWHAMRRTGIGGTDVAAIMGLSPWRTAYEVYLEKLGELPLQEPTEPQRWGTLHEPIILSEYARRKGVRLIKPFEMIRSKKNPHLLANPDAISEHDIVVEAKTARSGDQWGEPETDQVPVPYRLQAEHYMLTLGLSRADVVVLIGGNDLRIYHITADAELQEMILIATQAFWRLVQERTPPPVQTLEDAKHRWGHLALSNPNAVVANDAQLEAHAQLVSTNAKIKELEVITDSASAQIMSALADRGDTLVDSTGRVLATWKAPKPSKRFDAEAFKLACPAQHAQYLVDAKASRRLLIKEPKQ